eukprot:jgi/Mesvir1/24779/Mv22033-RA.1
MATTHRIVKSQLNAVNSGQSTPASNILSQTYPTDYSQDADSLVDDETPEPEPEPEPEPIIKKAPEPSPPPRRMAPVPAPVPVYVVPEEAQRWPASWPSGAWPRTYWPLFQLHPVDLPPDSQLGVGRGEAFDYWAKDPFEFQSCNFRPGKAGRAGPSGPGLIDECPLEVASRCSPSSRNCKCLSAWLNEDVCDALMVKRNLFEAAARGGPNAPRPPEGNYTKLFVTAGSSVDHLDGLYDCPLGLCEISMFRSHDQEGFISMTGTHMFDNFYSHDGPILAGGDGRQHAVKILLQWASYLHDANTGDPDWYFKGKIQGVIGWPSPGAVPGVLFKPFRHGTFMPSWLWQVQPLPFARKRGIAMFVSSRSVFRDPLLAELKQEIEIDSFGEYLRTDHLHAVLPQCTLMWRKGVPENSARLNFCTNIVTREKSSSPSQTCNFSPLAEAACAIYHYKFAIAVESVPQPTYVTEQLWRCLQYGAVPIVAGPARSYAWLPKGSYVRMEDFRTTKVRGSLPVMNVPKAFHYKLSFMRLSMAKRQQHNVDCADDGRAGTSRDGENRHGACLLRVLAALQSRTMVCAPTNVAVQVVGWPPAACYRAGLDLLPVRHGLPCRLAEIVLVAAEGKVDVEGDMRFIILTERVKRLEACVDLEHGFTATTQDGKYPGMESEAAEPRTMSRGLYLRVRLYGLLKRLCDLGGVLLEEAPCMNRDDLNRLASRIRRAAQLLDHVKLEAESSLDGAFDLLVKQSKGRVRSPVSAVTMASGSAKVGHGGMIAESESSTGQPASSSRVEWCRNQGRHPAECSHGLCTVASAGRPIMREKAGGFQTVVVDEAAQLVEAETCILLASPATTCMDQLVLVGDPKQLPATVLSMNAKACGYDRSLFERLQSNGWRVFMLDTQYRMHPDISRWPNRAFYDGRLKDAPTVCSPELLRQDDTWRAKVLQSPPSSPCSAFVFVDVATGREERDASTRSILNQAEEEHARCLVEQIIAAIEEAGRKRPATGQGQAGMLTIGVISPYKAQARQIEEQLRAAGHAVDVHTVDGFQGQERDIIIISAVRANASGNVGFLQDHRRLQA